MQFRKRKMSKRRWLVANREEKRDIGKAELVNYNLALRRYTWSRLIGLLKEHLGEINKATRILEIGGGPTTIFLALRQGEKWAVDPNHDLMFQLHPFMREVEEYKDVNFLSCPVEEVVLDKQFDVIFAINSLDHTGDLRPVANKVDELLAHSGVLIIIVDCYADSVVRNIIRWFDVDLPHPHHFVAKDILSLFSHYKLIKRDDKILEVFSENPFPTEESVRPRGIRYLLARYWEHVHDEGKGNPFFSLKYLACFSLALLIAWLRRQEKPVYPLKKLRLFIFQKP